MNARTIIAADGLPRRAFTVADVERMVEVGLMAEDERVELVYGELIPMSPKGNQHEALKTALTFHWVKRCPPEVLLTPETTFRLSLDTYFEPDFVFFSRSTGIRGLNGSTALLAVEISASSLGYDLGRKALVYADFGVRELWVIDAVRGFIHVHRDPGPDGYRSVVRFEADELVVPMLAPECALRLADLDVSE